MLGADDAVAGALRARGWPERPLVDQPLALDLLNTRWVVGGTPYDLLDHDELTAAWLIDRELDRKPLPREQLREARDALAAVIADPADCSRLNALLWHGRLRLEVGEHGEVEHYDVADPVWRAAWACLRDYLRLRAEALDRLRKCANPDCVLHFLDTSRTGRRQWCSMTACGNRLKARRHHDRSRGRA
ncbi:putative RNA-binding Zn ribbon-like protein [Saccharothrix tamanrassetensis]|uniref:Putative RNA-binding Zn ribbon-like protein n=1 Tax=Saccharothrix tamanrassetensis TaxID=1051531 RepID=A0A841CNR8_9PSEU|nr:CGNR zinc finger domain-containing protein [Saccharothrix tamanrassetensis]MBB5960102.1 putative RNA-binding Zn ribbon-like protein [Saccharothrix tamanrassetensis]